MSLYIDGFLLPVPIAELDRYREIAEFASKIYQEHGALSYHECVGDDLRIEGTQAFPDLLHCNEGETVMFSWATFASREARDAANAKIMSDPRLTEMCNPENAPFDCKRMAYGGFRSFVSA